MTQEGDAMEGRAKDWNLAEWRRRFYDGPAVWLMFDREGEFMAAYESEEAVGLAITWYAKRGEKVTVRRVPIYSLALSQERLLAELRAALALAGPTGGATSTPMCQGRGSCLGGPIATCQWPNPDRCPSSVGKAVGTPDSIMKCTPHNATNCPICSVASTYCPHPNTCSECVSAAVARELGERVGELERACDEYKRGAIHYRDMAAEYGKERGARVAELEQKIIPRIEQEFEAKYIKAHELLTAERAAVAAILRIVGPGALSDHARVAQIRALLTPQPPRVHVTTPSIETPDALRQFLVSAAEELTASLPNLRAIVGKIDAAQHISRALLAREIGPPPPQEGNA